MRELVFGLMKSLPLPVSLRLMTLIAAQLNARDLRVRDGDVALGHEYLKENFRKSHERELDLENPRIFSEKLQWRKVHDRNPMFPLVADKILAKDWAEEKLGENLSVPDLFVVSDPNDLPEDIADTECILKVTHASGRNIVINPAEGRNRADIVVDIGWMLFRDYGHLMHEWHYHEIDRKIIAEPLLKDRYGNPPKTLRAHCFDGVPFMLQFDGAAFDHTTRKTLQMDTCFLSQEWELLPIGRSGEDRVEVAPEKPARLEKILHVVRTLSTEFDYIRVDIFLVDDAFYLSELTLFPASGFKRYEPEEFAEQMGDAWTLPKVAQSG